MATITFTLFQTIEIDESQFQTETGLAPTKENLIEYAVGNRGCGNQGDWFFDGGDLIYDTEFYPTEKKSVVVKKIRRGKGSY
jgi:hypothetical protein